MSVSHNPRLTFLTAICSCGTVRSSALWNRHQPAANLPAASWEQTHSFSRIVALQQSIRLALFHLFKGASMKVWKIWERSYCIITPRRFCSTVHGLQTAVYSSVSASDKVLSTCHRFNIGADKSRPLSILRLKLEGNEFQWLDERCRDDFRIISRIRKYLTGNKWKREKKAF